MAFQTISETAQETTNETHVFHAKAQAYEAHASVHSCEISSLDTSMLMQEPGRELAGTRCKAKVKKTTETWILSLWPLNGFSNHFRDSTRNYK